MKSENRKSKLNLENWIGGLSVKYFETTVAHNSNFDFIDKGYNVKPNITIEELRIYGMSRLNRGEIKGWYVETDVGEVIEKHTHVIC